MIKISSIENYEIIKEIGKGSFSNVYLVKKKENQKYYALKKVNISNMSTKERENALKEVNFLAEIKDNNVIGYEESFYDKDMNILYLVMEYAPYGDLNKIITNNNKLKIYFSESELLNIYLQIASGLKAIHAKHIIHRDLKSANIFITQKNDLILKIGDFNVSKKIDYFNLKNTQTGTPYYASPEIWENKPYDFKSDIWSLGCLFYEIASLSTPFKGLNMKELFECIEKGVFAPLPKHYSNNITKIIKMCLRHEANLRPDSSHIKYLIENLKSEQHFKKLFDESYHNNNIINNNFPKNNIKRPISYIKKSTNLNLDNFELPELDNSNIKNIILNNNNHNHNNNNFINFKVINEKKKKNLTPIKINYHYFIKEKIPIKLNINPIKNEINNKIVNIRDNNYSHIYKTENNNVINIENNSPERIKKEYYNIKLKPSPYKKLKKINNELEEINKIKEEKDNNNLYQKEEYIKNQLAQKFNTIKNPLKQIDGKISVNNSQSIPEVINNSDTQSSQRIDKNNEKINMINGNIHINQNRINNFNYKNINDIHNKEKMINEKNDEQDKFSKKVLKQNNSNLILSSLKPNGYFFQKKPLKNLSTININKRPVSSLITMNALNNNNDNISKIFDNYNNYNLRNKNTKSLPKIKLKPITSSIRSITPFNDNNKEKFESKIVNERLNYNNIDNKKYNNINNIKNNINDKNIINYNDERYFLKEKKNIRQLNINKSKLNNLSQIKTKFVNFIKPNYKNIDILYNKTEI